MIRLMARRRGEKMSIILGQLLLLVFLFSTAKEREACDLLKDARLKIVEELEQRKESNHVDRSRA
jgi:hypothetical protein